MYCTTTTAHIIIYRMINLLKSNVVFTVTNDRYMSSIQEMDISFRFKTIVHINIVHWVVYAFLGKRKHIWFFLRFWDLKYEKRILRSLSFSLLYWMPFRWKETITKVNKNIDREKMTVTLIFRIDYKILVFFL